MPLVTVAAVEQAARCIVRVVSEEPRLLGQGGAEAEGRVDGCVRVEHKRRTGV